MFLDFLKMIKLLVILFIIKLLTWNNMMWLYFTVFKSQNDDSVSI